MGCIIRCSARWRPRRFRLGARDDCFDRIQPLARDLLRPKSNGCTSHRDRRQLAATIRHFRFKHRQRAPDMEPTVFECCSDLTVGCGLPRLHVVRGNMVKPEIRRRIDRSIDHSNQCSAQCFGSAPGINRCPQQRMARTRLGHDGLRIDFRSLPQWC